MKNRNTWLAFVLGVIITIAVVLLLWPDRNHHTHSSEYSQIVANDDSVKSHKAQYLFIIDSINKDKARLQDENKSLREGQATTRKQLDLKTAEARELAKEVQRRNKDTALQAIIDSLVERIESLTFLVVQYEQYADSINNVNDSLRINHEAMIKEKDKRIAELQVAYDGLYKINQFMAATNQGLRKDLKQQKTQKKILAVLAGAAAVLGLIK